MYSTTKCAVRQGNLCSDFFYTTLGVKQGDNLSPTLFNIFVDDFESYFDNVISYPVSLGDITFNHLFFADDLVLISESAKGLQNCMDTLSNYCMEWKLHVNLVCSTRKPKICYGFYYNNSIVEITDQYKYLGIILQSNGSLKHAGEDLAARARKAYFALKRKLPFDTNHSLTKLVAKAIQLYYCPNFNIFLRNVDLSF